MFSLLLIPFDVHDIGFFGKPQALLVIF